MIDANALSVIMSQDVNLRLVEPHIYSTHSPGENTNSYDRMGVFYDLVMCSRLYNRFIWGYSISEYDSLVHNALTSSKDGWVLDAACGSLAFTAGSYVRCSERPIIFLDQSIKLLRLAKARLTKLHGTVPANMVFLHGNVLQLPFVPKSFDTVISLNVLHVLQDVKRVLRELGNVLADGGTISFTTLVKGNRLADKYLHMAGRTGELVPRSTDQVVAVFDQVDMPIEYQVKGNMMFIYYGRKIL